MAPYHVARSSLLVRERAPKPRVRLDIAQIEANIEHTRFPVPEDEQHQSTDDFPGLVRAADLIGQLADINYLRKQTALFEEFRETGSERKTRIQLRGGSAVKLSRFLLEDGSTLYWLCAALPSSHARGSTVDRQSSCKRVLDSDEVWETVRDHFYDRDLHGLDWSAVRRRYRLAT